VKILPPVTLPVADTLPAVIKFPPVTVPVAVIIFALKLPMSELPVALKVDANTPVVPTLPMLEFPDTLKLTSVPVLVIFGCAAVVTVPAVVAAPLSAPVNVVAPTLPAEILPVTDNTPVVLSKLKPLLPPKFPLSLNYPPLLFSTLKLPFVSTNSVDLPAGGLGTFALALCSKISIIFSYYIIFISLSFNTVFLQYYGL